MFCSDKLEIDQQNINHGTAWSIYGSQYILVCAVCYTENCS